MLDIDTRQFSSILSCGKPAVSDLLRSFQLEFENKLSNIASIIVSEGSRVFKEELHQLKGTSATFGMSRLSQRIADLEYQELSVEALDDLRQLAERSFAALDLYLEKN